MQTKNVMTTELQVGQIVQCHGGRFLLEAQTFTADDAAKRVEAGIKGARYWAAQHGGERLANLEKDIAEVQEREGYCRAFRATFIEDVPGQTCSIPLGWRVNGWTIQGNRRAFWTVEL